MPACMVGHRKKPVAGAVGVLLAAWLAGMLCAGMPARAFADACPEGGEHDYAARIERHATAGEDGLRVFTCRKCGASFEDAIPKTGHDWGPWVRDVEPTCASEGLEHRICLKAEHAEHREERIVAALSATGEHTWVERGRVEPTCESAGEARYECGVCGERAVAPMAALGHDWGAWQPVLDDGGNPTGKEQRVCAHDNAHVETRDASQPSDAPDVAAGQEPAQPASPVAAHEESHVAAPAKPAEPAKRPSGPPQAEPQADPWSPNALDKALLAGDLVAIAGFLASSVPLFNKLAWIRARRKKAVGAIARSAYGKFLADPETTGSAVSHDAGAGR